MIFFGCCSEGPKVQRNSGICFAEENYKEIWIYPKRLNAISFFFVGLKPYPKLPETAIYLFKRDQLGQLPWDLGQCWDGGQVQESRGKEAGV